MNRVEKKFRRTLYIASICMGLISMPGLCQEKPAASVSTIEADGTAHFTVNAPLSSHLSEPARQYLRDFVARGGFPKLGSDIAEVRRNYDERIAKPAVAAWRQIYPVTIEAQTIGGVQTDVVVPVGKVSQTRILINLHGGAFTVGGGLGGQMEAIPMAGIGHVRVVTVNYRQGPEYKFPAASEDVASVYKALLKNYKAANIGIYGCSVGGLLTAQVVAWFQTHGLPPPGAIGIFCAGAMPIKGTVTDSSSVWQSLTILGIDISGDGSTSLTGTPRIYLRDAGNDDPLAWPGISQEVLAKFPPTLLLTSTRDPWMSNAIITNARLIRAGVTSELYIQEGLGHGFMNLMPGVPEAIDAYKAAWRFFDKALFY